jgi:hypothetical protein
VIVEIVDSPERITGFVRDCLDRLMVGGMLTLERAAVMMYRRRPRDQAVPNLNGIIARHCARCASDLPPGAGYCPVCGLPTQAPAGAPSVSGVPGPGVPGPGVPGPAAPRPDALQLAAELKPLSTIPSLEPGAHMTVNENGILLRVFIGESDEFQRKPLYEAIVQKVRELGLAGATVLRGTEGFGANSVVHKASLVDMSTDLPIVIEVIDTEDKIRTLLPHLEGMVQEGMITMEYVVILMYRHDAGQGPQPVPPPADAPRP